MHAYMIWCHMTVPSGNGRYTNVSMCTHHQSCAKLNSIMYTTAHSQAVSEYTVWYIPSLLYYYILLIAHTAFITKGHMVSHTTCTMPTRGYSMYMYPQHVHVHVHVVPVLLDVWRSASFSTWQLLMDWWPSPPGRTRVLGDHPHRNT